LGGRFGGRGRVKHFNLTIAYKTAQGVLTVPVLSLQILRKFQK
jgi:hypothetical protein